MEFWGVEIKPGEPLRVTLEENKMVIMSQVALGEVNNKKEADCVLLYLNIGTQKLVVGSLSAEDRPQMKFALVLDRTFELSHNWKNGSVYFFGYILSDLETGKLEAKAVEVEPAKNKDPAADSKKDDESDEDEDSDDSEEDSSEVSDDDMEDLSNESSDDDEMDEDEETPKKVEQVKKRPSESANKTPMPPKKAKLDTPQKTDDKEGGGNLVTKPTQTPANGKKSEQNPKSFGNSCTEFAHPQSLEVKLRKHFTDS